MMVIGNYQLMYSIILYLYYVEETKTLPDIFIEHSVSFSMNNFN